MARVVPAPLLPTIEQALGASHGEAGSLFLVTSAGYFIALVCSGFVSSRITHRNTIILSACAVGLAMMGISLSKSLLGIRLGMLLVGIAAGFYLPSGIATLTSMVSSTHWGKAIAIHELAPNLTFIMAPLVCEAMLLFMSWRGILAVLGLAALLSGAAFAVFGTGGRFPGQAPSFAAFRTLFRERAFWIMVVLFSVGISGSLGVYSMLPLYLVSERGIDRNWANTLIALSRLSGPFMAFVAGWVNDRLGPRVTMAGTFLLTGICTVCMGIVPDSLVIVFVFLQPVVAVCFFPSGFAALSRIGTAGTRNVAVSLTVPTAFMVGGGAVPVGIGMMGDASSFSAGMALAGVFILSGFVVSLFLRFPDNPG